MLVPDDDPEKLEAEIVLANVAAPPDVTENLETPFNCKSAKLPVNPEAALIPKPVPLVDQVLEVAPEGSIRSCGLVLVEVPPLNQVPVKASAGVEAIPLNDEVRPPFKAT